VQYVSASVASFLTILGLACGYALWRGRLPERVAAVALILAWLASDMVLSRDFSRPQYGMFWVDLILMVILVALALLSNRRWLMVAAACHLLTVGDHFAMMLDHRILSYAYQAVMTVWGYAVILAMVLGTFFEAESERRRLRQA
jgi:hypothetical protein